MAADSGNGYHLLYRIDLPCDDGKVLEQVLTALADRFNGDGVKLDRSVHNQAQIVRLYGTLAAKGDNTEERSHRLSKILKAPETLQVVSAEQLRALAKELQPAKAATVELPTARNGAFDVDGFLARHGIAAAEKTIQPDDTIKWRLEHCPFNPDHETPDAAVFQFPDGKLGYKCFHNSCADKHWNDFRRLFEPDYDYGKAERQARRETPRAEGGGAWDEDSSELTSLTSLGDAEYPPPPDEAAYYGLAGEIVRRIAPHTEADPVALLVQFLVAFGNIIKRKPHAVADGAWHYLNLFCVLVGETSKGRKGTALQHMLQLFTHADEGWRKNCLASGLSSGEGVIHAVRDEIRETKPAKEKGKYTGESVDVVTDTGVTDKRLMVIESEFCSPLKVMSREGNTLSPTLRQAWDTGNLRTLTKNSPARATESHVSIIGHITRQELRRFLTETESANGFGNRILWVAARRSKCLPEGGGSYCVADLVTRLHSAIEFAQTAGKVHRSDSARELWARVYPNLSQGEPGLLGMITARAEAQVLRLSCIYALLDCSATVEVDHLRAALALWRYCEDSARWIFGTGTGNKNADRILAALMVAGEKGLTKEQITADVFKRNVPGFDIDEALRLLHSLNLAHRVKEKTSGRTRERWLYKATGHEVNEVSPPADGKTAHTSFSSYDQPSQNASSAESYTDTETLIGDELGVARL
jgi:hypothetical protein